MGAWSPQEQLKEHPGWEIVITELDGKYELFVPEAKTIFLDRWAYEVDHRHLTAHALAHLSLHADDLLSRTVEQEAEADWLANIRTGKSRIRRVA